MAAPDIANNVVSGNEFSRILDITDNADTILNEAEAWAVGTKAGEPVTADQFSYTVEGNDSLQVSITEETFRSQVGESAGYTRYFIFTCDGVPEGGSTNAWHVEQGGTTLYNINLADYGITITSGTPLQSNIIRVIVTDNDIQYENNAKYYSEEAEKSWDGLVNLGVTASRLEPGSEATVTKTIDSSGHYLFTFGVPEGLAGADGSRGPQGPSTVWSSSSAPPSGEGYTVWLNPEGTVEPILLSADQMSYTASASYGENTIGYVVQDVESSMGAIASIAVRAEDAAERAEEASSELEVVIEQIKDKITCPSDLPDDTGFLQVTTIYSEDPEADIEPEFSWKAQLDYDNDLYNLPQIEGVTLQSNLTLDDLGIAPSTGSPVYYTFPSGGVPYDDLAINVVQSLNLADSAVQTIQMNGSNFTPADGIVNLGIPGVQKIVMNREDYNPTNGVIDLGIVLTEMANTNIGPNYLDNAWFTINQRGITSYNGESGNSATIGTYICDRWKVIEDELPYSRTISIENDTISISSAPASIFDPTKSFSIGQIIDDEAWAALSGRQITCSVNYSFDGSEYITEYFDFQCPSYHSDTDDVFKHQLNSAYGWGMYIDTRTINDEPKLVFSILWAGNVWGDNLLDTPIYLAKTKMELGVFPTLEVETQPKYEAELAKCQRYYRLYGGEPSTTSKPIVIGHGISASASLLEWNLMFDAQMVKQPIITSTVDLAAKRGFTAATGSIGAITSAQLAASSYFESIGNLCLQTVASNLTVGTGYYLILPATAAVASGSEIPAKLILSAEP